MKMQVLPLLFGSIYLFVCPLALGTTASEPRSSLFADSPVWDSDRFIEEILAKISEREDLQILLLLKAKGVQRIGGETIDQVIDQALATKIKVEFDLNSPYLNSDGTLRKSARWEVGKDGRKTIFLSLNEAYKSLTPPLMIHESLGTADRNFAPSTFFRLYYQSPLLQKSLPSSLLEKILNIRQERERGNFQLNGTSGVGGGGDYRIQYYMYVMYLGLAEHLIKGRITPEQFADFTCSITDKFDFDISSNGLRGKFESEIQTMPDGIQRIKVLLPDLESFGSFRKTEYGAELSKNLAFLIPITELILETSSNACSRITKRNP